MRKNATNFMSLVSYWKMSLIYIMSITETLHLIELAVTFEIYKEIINVKLIRAHNMPLTIQF